ncbi:hypothetical protein DV964_13710, partial [Staphylococcus pseudintermedius]
DFIVRTPAASIATAGGADRVHTREIERTVSLRCTAGVGSVFEVVIELRVKVLGSAGRDEDDRSDRNKECEETQGNEARSTHLLVPHYRHERVH